MSTSIQNFPSPVLPAPGQGLARTDGSVGTGSTDLSGLHGVNEPTSMGGGRNDRDVHSANDHTYPPPNPNGHMMGVPDDQIVKQQQASTNPGDGSTVQSHNVPFKERVVGVAQKTRGTLLGKPDLKEHGKAILEGRTTHAQDKHSEA
ncbi:hypothetical protein D9611_007500 [Ephemerocybe angulata]|uniref:Uncharacterized protein n=1 Tax=Ephemerocybe angulata TaxID=980116 RepID=A0A8H5CFD7_9AGAR|nr:hypothetical protein D9611_007500 [Tulosesus angulatus]